MQQNLFDGTRSEKLKREGMAKAAGNADLSTAREIAKQLAKWRGTVTADDVGRVLKSEHNIDTLGPAAGSLFRGKEWEFTGQWIKSKRITNHSRMIRVWRLRNGR